MGLGPCAHLLLGRMGLVGPHAHLSSSGCDLLLLLLLLGIGVSGLGLWFEIWLGTLLCRIGDVTSHTVLLHFLQFSAEI